MEEARENGLGEPNLGGVLGKVEKAFGWVPKDKFTKVMLDYLKAQRPPVGYTVREIAEGIRPQFSSPKDIAALGNLHDLERRLFEYVEGEQVQIIARAGTIEVAYLWVGGPKRRRSPGEREAQDP